MFNNQMLQKGSFATTGKIVSRVCVTAALLWFLFSNLDFSLIKNIIARTDLVLFLLSFILLAGRNIASALRWKILLEVCCHTTSVMLLTKFYFIGLFFNFFLPTSVGGDIARGYYLYSRGGSKAVAISSILAERLMGVASLAILSLLGLLWKDEAIPSVELKGVILGFNICLLLVFFCS